MRRATIIREESARVSRGFIGFQCAFIRKPAAAKLSAERYNAGRCDVIDGGIESSVLIVLLRTQFGMTEICSGNQICNHTTVSHSIYSIQYCPCHYQTILQPFRGVVLVERLGCSLPSARQQPIQYEDKYLTVLLCKLRRYLLMFTVQRFVNWTSIFHEATTTSFRFLTQDFDSAWSWSWNWNYTIVNMLNLNTKYTGSFLLSPCRTVWTVLLLFIQFGRTRAQCQPHA
jgi:hypothetical protein